MISRGENTSAIAKSPRERQMCVARRGQPLRSGNFGTTNQTNSHESGEAQGGAWASQAGGVFANPHASELAEGLSKNSALFASRMTLLLAFDARRCSIDSLWHGIVKARPRSLREEIFAGQAARSGQ
jgi:hypothetical protein